MEILSESERVGAGRWNWMKRITFNRWQHRYQLRVYLEWYREQLTSIRGELFFYF